MTPRPLSPLPEALALLAAHRRCARADRPAPRRAPADFAGADAFVWQAAGRRLAPGAEGQPGRDRRSCAASTGSATPLPRTPERFARGLPANNALLWGARGMGKSSLVKAVHAEINRAAGRRSTRPLKLIEIHREDIETLPELMALLRPDPHRFIVFCDDLSFDGDDTSYKSLKAVLEGGIEGRPDNVIFYATSNRRHLLPRDMMENERSTAINPGEAVEEKVSLSDRFGLWLGFHKCSQDEYLEMVFAYVDHFGLDGRPGRDPRRGPRMGDDPRRALGPHRLAVHPGPRRPAGQGAGGVSLIPSPLGEKVDGGRSRAGPSPYPRRQRKMGRVRDPIPHPSAAHDRAPENAG